jgi:hypothetical protein
MTPVEPASLPIIAITSTFLFVLLIILLTKAPKAGACVVSMLFVILPLAMLLGHRSWGALSIPVFSIWATFLFVLLIILLTRQPKVGAALVVMLVVMGVFALILLPLASHRRAAHRPMGDRIAMAQVGLTRTQQTESGAGSALVEQRVQAVQEFDRVFSDHTRPAPPSAAAPLLGPGSVPQPPEPAVVSPIWSEGVEQEFAADICPSKAAAARALGARAYRVIRELPQDGNAPAPIVFFQEEQDRTLIVELKNAVTRLLPERTCTVEAEMRNLRPGEIGITLQFPAGHENYAPWAKSSGAVVVTRGDALVNVFTTERRTTVQQSYTEKPWVENFAGFADARPEMHFIVTRSRETCTSEGEARQQALEDARARLTKALNLRPRSKVARIPLPAISATDVLQGGFIVDQFAQSFDGTAGKIWRQAMLLDVSGPKLSQLADLKSRQLHAQKMSWGRMGLSALGVVVLIGAIYFFLNMATRGYYEWSLRIAGVILAIVAIISILMIVH